MNVLMTGAGAPGGPGIIKCLQTNNQLNLIVCDINEQASGRFLNNAFFVGKSANDPDFLEFMLEKCQTLKIDVLFPLVTKELFIFSKHKKLFSQIGTKVIVSEFESLNIANNKGLLHIHLSKHNLPTPNYQIAKTIEEVESAFDSLGFPNKKICIKPTISNGSRGVRIIDPSADEYNLLFNEKPNSLYIGKEKLLEILKGHTFPELLIAEFLPGEEFTVDTLVENGILKLVIPRLRTKLNGGISVAGEILKNEEIIEQVKKISASLKLNGPIGYQFKKDDNGAFKILEMNPRIQGTSVSLMGAGVNLPLLAVEQELGIKTVIPDVKWGTKFVRYYNEIYY
jgi:carbamoyl-phosphate synthase large subunit